ncbi:hypothetical protein PR202_gb07578 [Eleusine coracana subsp. coracana]|uniref:Secreted protein n=1 Tax=Eleusine coracana subsp. coracana TaxID=191504 RepID=A0AAV5ECJ4_ELECO|nr:hypothetical protein PR202_gb07578 [Eleusine coracana subsp. coracana]
MAPSCRISASCSSSAWGTSSVSSCCWSWSWREGRSGGDVAARRERWYRETRLVATTDSSSSAFSRWFRYRPPPHGQPTPAPPVPVEAEVTVVFLIAGAPGEENVGRI